MSSNLDKIDYNGWPGGLNVLEDKSMVLPNQLTEATNIIIRAGGVIANRPGMVTITSVAKATRYYSSWQGSSTKFVAHNSDKTLTYTPTVGAPVVLKTYANDQMGMFEFFNSTMLHTNGIDAMQRWDLAAATSSDVAGAPVCQILLRHNDRIFAAVGSVVYETTVNTAIDFAGGAAWNVGLGEGGIITGLASLGSDLFIFKYNSIYIMTGYSKAERQTRIFLKDVGTIEPYSIKTVTLDGVGECVVFLSTNKKLCYLNLSGFLNIGESVQPILDTIPLAQSFGSTYFPTKTQAVFNAELNQYMLTFENAAGTFRPTLLCLHLKSPYKSQFGLRWGFTKYYNGIDTASYYPISYDAMCESIKYGIIFASPDTFAAPVWSFNQFLTGLNKDGIGAGLAIPAIFRTRDEDIENHASQKTWRNLLVRLSSSTTSSFSATLTFTEYTDETNTAKTSTEVIVPTSATSWGNVFDYWIELCNQAKTCSVKFDFTGNNSPFSSFRISQITLFYKKNQVENRK